MAGKKTTKSTVKKAKKTPSRAIVQQPVAPMDRLPDDYRSVLEQIKTDIRSAQHQASLSVNRHLILLYWRIGREILQRQDAEGWGSKVIDRLAADLHQEFPELEGLSSRNLKYMRAFAKAWPNEEMVQQAVAQIPWGHNLVLLTKIKDAETCLWYARQAVANGWSRNVLALQIETGLHKRQGKALTNFQSTLPAPQSDLARETLKDPYLFDFLTVGIEARERDIEKNLVAHVRDFLLELGAGFAFVGEQVHLEVAEQDYYLDLLFYHLKLRCYIVVELKAGAFKPEYAGQLNFYLSAVDDLLRHPEDRPTIGLLLCRDKNRVTVEYALRDIKKPIGVSQWQTRLVEALPKALKGSLPSVEEIEKELRDEK